MIFDSSLNYMIFKNHCEVAVCRLLHHITLMSFGTYSISIALLLLLRASDAGGLIFHL